jgi:predicted small secreted protein
MTREFSKIRLAALVAIAALAIVALSGCNTLRGVGQDVTAFAEGMTELASKN